MLDDEMGDEARCFAQPRGAMRDDRLEDGRSKCPFSPVDVVDQALRTCQQRCTPHRSNSILLVK